MVDTARTKGRALMRENGSRGVERSDAAQEEPILCATNLVAGYGKRTVLHGVDLAVGSGQFMGLIGHNGAGKSTLLRCLMGLTKPSRGTVATAGEDVTGSSAATMVRRGVSLVPQGNTVFPNLTIHEHLKLCGRGRSRADLRTAIDTSFDLFPVLRERRTGYAGEMSGGQRQMLAIACALVQGPRVMLLDEPSIGLAPILVDQVMEAITRINSELDTSVLVVEQDAPRLMRQADRIVVLKLGETVFEGTPGDLKSRDWLELF